MTQKPAAPTPRTPFAAKLVIGLSCLNLLALCLVNYLLYLVSETWWVGTVLTYSPRAPLLIPTLILLLAALIWHRYSLGMNLVSAGIVLVPIMGLSLPLDLWLNGAPVTEGEMVLKIVSCNVQSFQPDFGKIIAEIQAIKPDVVVLQEAFGDHDWLSDPQFRDWHSVHHGQYWVASRYRVSLLSDCEVTQFGGRLAGMLAQIDLPHAAAAKLAHDRVASENLTCHQRHGGILSAALHSRSKTARAAILIGCPWPDRQRLAGRPHFQFYDSFRAHKFGMLNGEIGGVAENGRRLSLESLDMRCDSIG